MALTPKINSMKASSSTTPFVRGHRPLHCSFSAALETGCSERRDAAARRGTPKLPAGRLAVDKEPRNIGGLVGR